MQLIKRLGWLGLWLLVGGVAWAGPTLQGLSVQSSPAAGEGWHLFAGKNLTTLAISWNTGTAARYLMIFDAAGGFGAAGGPLNGPTTACTTSHSVACLLWCGFVPNSTSAPNIQTFDWTTHPVSASLGLVAALSTAAGCGSFTVDSGADWYAGQVY